MLVYVEEKDKYLVLLINHLTGHHSSALRLMITRMSSTGVMTPVPGRIAGIFHVPLAGTISQRLAMAAAMVKISFSAKVRPLHMPGPIPHGLSLP